MLVKFVLAVQQYQARAWAWRGIFYMHECITVGAILYLGTFYWRSATFHCWRVNTPTPGSLGKAILLHGVLHLTEKHQKPTRYFLT